MRGGCILCNAQSHVYILTIEYCCIYHLVTMDLDTIFKLIVCACGIAFLTKSLRDILANLVTNVLSAILAIIIVYFAWNYQNVNLNGTNLDFTLNSWQSYVNQTMQFIEVVMWNKQQQNMHDTNARPM